MSALPTLIDSNNRMQNVVMIYQVLSIPVVCTFKAGARRRSPCNFRVIDEDMYELPAVDQLSWILVALSTNTSVRIRSLRSIPESVAIQCTTTYTVLQQ